MAKARIAVIGAGLMGHGIAQVFALAGHDVAIYDPVAASLDSAKARIVDQSARISATINPPSSACGRRADLAAAVRDADYVVEAVLEDLAAEAEAVRRDRAARAAATRSSPATPR